MSGGGKPERQRESEAEREVARIAAEKWQFYLDKFKPVEDWAMVQTQQMNTASAISDVTGRANVDANIGLSAEFGKAAIDPNSSQMNRVLSEREKVGGQVAGRAQGRAALGAQDRYLNSMANLSAIGQGNEATALTGLNTLTNLNFQQTQGDIKNSLNNRMLRQQAIGMPVGVGASVYANSLANQKPQTNAPVGGDPYDDYNYTPSTNNQYGSSYGLSTYGFGGRK